MLITISASMMQSILQAVSPRYYRWQTASKPYQEHMRKPAQTGRSFKSALSFAGIQAQQ